MSALPRIHHISDCSPSNGERETIVRQVFFYPTDEVSSQYSIFEGWIGKFHFKGCGLHDVIAGTLIEMSTGKLSFFPFVGPLQNWRTALAKCSRSADFSMSRHPLL